MLKTVTDRQDAIAAERIQTILPLLEEGISANEKKVRRHEAAARLGCSVRTVDRYVQNYRKEGFSGLKPKNFGKLGRKVIEQDYVKQAIAMRLGNSHRSVFEICRAIEWRNRLEPGTLKRSTMQDALANAGFAKQQLPKIVTKQAERKARGRFQKEHRMEMLQGDIKYSEEFPLGPNGEYVKTYFIAWIDDCTRFVTSANFYSSMTTDDVVACFKNTVTSYGVPSSIYVDNGSQYISHQLMIVCSKLGVKMKFAPLRDGAAKGKIEAVNRLMEKFNTEVALMRDSLTTIEEVNAYFHSWLETEYHDREHSETGMKPREAFENDTAELLMIEDGKVLEDAFSYQLERMVTGSVVSIGGTDYVVEDPRHKGHRVRLTPTEDPFVWNVYRKGFPPCRAYTEKIGPYVDMKRQFEILRTYTAQGEMADVSPDTSPVILEMAKDKYIKKHGSELFEEAERARREKLDRQIAAENAAPPAISYRNICMKEDN